MTIEDAEKIRKKLGLDREQFSFRIGYSSRSYAMAVKRGVISRWMSAEIRRRFWRHVEAA